MRRFAVVVMLLTLAGSAAGSTIRVPSDLPTIQAAIDSAITDDTVLVSPGTYAVNLEIIEKTITLLSTDGRDQTILEPLDIGKPILYRAFTQDLDEITHIEGFTFRDATLSRGVWLERCRVLFRNNAIGHCTSDSDGAGMYSLLVRGVIENNRIHDNATPKNGGGVFLAMIDSDSVVFQSNILYNNAARQGSAIYIKDGWTDSHIMRNILHHNGGTDTSAALYVYDSQAEVTNNTIVSNNAGYGRFGGGTFFFGNILAFNRTAAIVGMKYPSVGYCCVYGNGGPAVEVSYGTTENPLFVDTASHDYSLTAASPCINQGLWSDQRRDPDGTRNDIGAIPYTLTQPVADRLLFTHYPMEHMISHYPTLTWQLLDSTATTQLSYEFEVAAEREPFADIHWQTGTVLSDDTSVTYAGDSLLDGHDYIYRIRLTTSTGTGDWCYGAFHMNTLPPTPTPRAPVDGYPVPATAVQLRADSVMDAEDSIVHYDFELFAGELDSVAIWSYYDSFKSRTTVDMTLSAGETYWWRIRSNDQFEHSAWSERRSFTVRSGPTTVQIPGDFYAIQTALDFLASGDTIKITPGSYSGPGYRDLRTYDKAVVVMSTAGPEWTTIDLAGTGLDPHRLLVPHEKSGIVFRGFTITGGYADTGGVVMSSRVLFDDCILQGNSAQYGGVVAGDYGLSLADCVIDNNSASEAGGVSYRTDIAAENCTFSANVAPRGGVGYEIDGTFTGSTFRDNEATEFGSCFVSGNIHFDYCLLIRNSGPSLTIWGQTYFDHCTIAFNEETVAKIGWDFGALFKSCIVAFNGGLAGSCQTYPDPPFPYPAGAIVASHSDIAGNYFDFIECLSDDAGMNGNISLDPMFCDPDNNNFHLQAGSPCLGTGENGTDIGAFGAGCTPTDVDDPADNGLPTTYALQQNYPNPFNPSTLIAFDLPKQSAVRLEVFNILGQRVRVLVDNTLPAGSHEATWDGTNAGGGAVSSGVYFYRLTTEDWSRSRKMLLLK